jgi:hypothetical protein
VERKMLGSNGDVSSSAGGRGMSAMSVDTASVRNNSVMGMDDDAALFGFGNGALHDVQPAVDDSDSDSDSDDDSDDDDDDDDEDEEDDDDDDGALEEESSPPNGGRQRADSIGDW